ncbi:LysM peptidoglycan-binding domain-containing protein [Micromonospora sp. NBC_00362]|uniref:BTAD domain-containing putative transcriptional regulator n=1 Tax=Micromonospora sp. NBC_00362 TaxID=2975975 RepID=UPI00225BD2BC|nr:BTAD domain-containing putative transcriptional regulator [Micromonospora sp. NBC_00362]MCX5122023.1 LysM peptidoglycan-binding domain-containing protein [Micromonospora sp. NBC_00362]
MSSRAARVAAVTTSVSFTAGVPAVLASTGAWTPEFPSPDVTARQWIAEPLSTSFVIALIAAGAVTLWLLLSTAVLIRTYSALARRLHGIPTLRVPGPVQGITAALLGATAVTTATGAAAHATPTTSSGGGDQPTTQATTTPALQAQQADRDTASTVPTYTVKRGDSLSKIADRCLGDADRWPEIFALNRGVHHAEVGGTLRNPNLIHPGWTLDLPADATAPARPRTPVPPPPSPHQPEAPAAHTPPANPAPGTTTPHPPSPAPPITAAPDSGGEASPAPTASAPDTASPATPDTPSATDRATRGVGLPTGSWVDLGLALAITAAAALVWAQRRRRYLPRKPMTTPRMHDPDLTRMPRVIGQIRRGLRTAIGPHHPGDHAQLRGDHHDGYEIDHEPVLVAGGSDDRDAGAPTAGANASSKDDGAGAPPLPVAPALDNPQAALWPPAGLGLAGPGAQAAARGFLTAALACGGVDHPEARTQVVIPSTTATTLLGIAAAALPRTPRLTVTAGLDEALDLLEIQTMERARLVHQHDVDTVAQLRRGHPYKEALPPVMLLADPTTRHERARVAALLAQGRSLDIHGTLLGAWPEGDTVTVAADGTTTASDTHSTHVDRLAVLDPTETADLLATLAESHTGQPPAPTEQQARPHADPSAPDNPPSPSAHSAPTTVGRPAPHADNVAHDRTVTPTGSRQDNLAESESQPGHDHRGPLTAPGEAAAPDVPEGHAHAHPATGGSVDLQSRQVRVRVLGPPEIINRDPQRTPRAKSLELLVYLAVHNGAASTEAILDDLLPDAPASKAPGRLYTYVSGLRSVLRHTGGPGTYVSHPDHRYLLHPDTLDIDLWQMRAALREARQAIDPQTRTAALRRAVNAYTGPLAQDCDYEWVESYREAIRQEALDAYLALADILAGNPAQQIAVLDAAIAHHPLREDLYQQAMRARAELGHLDAIRTLRRQLTRALAQIDAEPRDDTIALADRLVAHLTPTAKPAPKSNGSAA